MLFKSDVNVNLINENKKYYMDVHRFESTNLSTVILSPYNKDSFPSEPGLQFHRYQFKLTPFSKETPSLTSVSFFDDVV